MAEVVESMIENMKDLVGVEDINELTKELGDKIGSFSGRFEVTVPDTAATFKAISRTAASLENSIVDVASMARRIEYGSNKALKYLNKGADIDDDSL